MGDDILPSAPRIWEHCEALARCSERADALTRVFLSKEQRAASDLVLGWMREAGMTAKLDEIGNCVATIVVATWEKDIDKTQARRVLDGKVKVDLDEHVEVGLGAGPGKAAA